LASPFSKEKGFLRGISFVGISQKAKGKPLTISLSRGDVTKDKKTKGATNALT
jgi:hypothetical protein